MSSIEVIALIVTAVCLISFSIVFTVLFRHYYLANINAINSGDEDIALIDNAIEEEKIKHSKGRKAVKLGFRIFGYAIFAFILVFFGCSVYSRFSGNIMPFGDTTLVVIATGSMSEKNSANTYLSGLDNQFDAYDIIGISSYQSQEEVELYDVVAYDSNGTTIVHRIIEITTDSEGVTCYTTRGDANSSSDTGSYYDGYLYYDDIIGYYNGTRIKAVGIFVVFLQSNAGIITIIAIAYCLFMFDFYNGKYEDAISKRTEKLVSLLGYDLSEGLDEDNVKSVYKQEVLYKDTIYTFARGEYVGKEVIEDPETLSKVKERMVLIQSAEEGELKDVAVKEVETEEVKTHTQLDEEGVNEVIGSLDKSKDD
ncbi:MAG: hypothetical protein Q4F15_06060 [Bacillota bacterium]|nr:hypothetical protein [Bacillota bacterium]